MTLLQVAQPITARSQTHPAPFFGANAEVIVRELTATELNQALDGYHPLGLPPLREGDAPTPPSPQVEVYERILAAAVVTQALRPVCDRQAWGLLLRRHPEPVQALFIVASELNGLGAEEVKKS